MAYTLQQIFEALSKVENGTPTTAARSPAPAEARADWPLAFFTNYITNIRKQYY